MTFQVSTPPRFTNCMHSPLDVFVYGISLEKLSLFFNFFNKYLDNTLKSLTNTNKSPYIESVYNITGEVEFEKAHTTSLSIKTALVLIKLFGVQT